VVALAEVMPAEAPTRAFWHRNFFAVLTETGGKLSPDADQLPKLAFLGAKAVLILISLKK
jgi:hypothetical protein